MGMNGMTGQDSMGRDRTGQDRTGQDRTGQDRTGQDRTGQDRNGTERNGTGRNIRQKTPATQFAFTSINFLYTLPPYIYPTYGAIEAEPGGLAQTVRPDFLDFALFESFLRRGGVQPLTGFRLSERIEEDDICCAQISRTEAESQWIVAQRPLSHVQYLVLYLSRIQRICLS